jgi:hypothetical protein
VPAREKEEDVTEKTLVFPQFPLNAHVRTCQECNHQQVTKDPATYKNELWRGLKCRKCKSEALDYGQKNRYTSEEWD